VLGSVTGTDESLVNLPRRDSTLGWIIFVMGHLREHRFRRLWASGSPILLGGGAVIITALGRVAVTSLTGTPNAATTAVSITPILFWSLLVGVIVGLIALLLQWNSDYRKRTYDPTWALKLGEISSSDAMLTRRSKAAECLKTDAQKLRSSEFTSLDVDAVLDFFEELGFYLRGDQITPEVAHHSFHYWIRGYYCAAREYVENAQETEATAWEHVKYLFETLHEVEIERSNGKHVRHLDKQQLDRFLDWEIALA